MTEQSRYSAVPIAVGFNPEQSEGIARIDTDRLMADDWSEPEYAAPLRRQTKDGLEPAPAAWVQWLESR
jgi:hypothetical protein